MVARLPRVALETTLLVHGVPRSASKDLARELFAVVRAGGAEPALCGVFGGAARTDLTEQDLAAMLAAPGPVAKLNTANLGLFLRGGGKPEGIGATTVSTTMELAARAGISVFATGGIGGVHRGYSRHPDISTDLAALARYPVAVVSAGCKSILDLAATREALETLGIPVIGYRCDRFPAFYRRESCPPLAVDGRFDNVRALGRYVSHELARSGRGVLVCNPISADDEIAETDWDTWMAQASAQAASAGATGREATPFILGALHELSAGRTLGANIALVKSNAALAAQLAAAMKAD